MKNRNIWIVLRREYLNIVRKKSFLISTFLVPLGFALIFAIQIISALMVEKEHYTVLVYKEDILTKNLTNSTVLNFQSTELSDTEIQAKVLADKHLLAIRLPNADMLSREGDPLVKVWGANSLSKPVLKELDSKISEAVKIYKRDKAGITEAQLKSVQFKLDIQTEKVTKEGAKRTDTGMAMVIGIVMNMLIYMMISIYGSILMQSVIEEKSSRIVEVIVSSVKPFHLLMGKTLAIALVAFTQMALWISLTTVVQVVGSLIVFGTVDMSSLQNTAGGSAAEQEMAMSIIRAMNSFNWTVLWFLPFFFLGGFFLYGSLLAGAGSAVDNIQDASQFTFPVTIPIMLPMLFMNNIIQNPNGSFAVFASIFPFFSPMTMMTRMALTEVPWWQVGLSMVLLALAFVGCIWLAGKVYRTGILMYGKKPTFKEMIKWLRY